MLKRIASELRRHAPFTASGALSGIIIMLIVVWGNFFLQVAPISLNIFYVLHPTHVVLSALVTTAMYMRYGKRKIWLAILIGYTGSIGIATISDSIIPYLGESLLALPNKGMHIGFIEKWWLVNPSAFLGIMIGYWKGTTRFPHYGHVLISTWASLFHVIMALGETINWIQIIIIFLFLFLAVWVPCCTSDIVYPLLFVRKT
jgi:hypothetical protein